jgi:hypothetical protein
MVLQKGATVTLKEIVECAARHFEPCKETGHYVGVIAAGKVSDSKAKQGAYVTALRHNDHQRRFFNQNRGWNNHGQREQTQSLYGSNDNHAKAGQDAAPSATEGGR